MKEDFTSEHMAIDLKAEPLRLLLADLAAMRENYAELQRAYGGSTRRFEHQRKAYRDRMDDERQEWQATRDELTHRAQQLTESLRAAEERLAYFESKCRRMANSFSWRSTAPLRAMRRWLID